MSKSPDAFAILLPMVTGRLKERLAEKISEHLMKIVRQNSDNSHNEMLSRAIAEAIKPGQDWMALASAPEIPEDKVGGYRYDVRFTLIAEDELDVDNLDTAPDLAEIMSECEIGNAYAGNIRIEKTPVDFLTRNALAADFGQHPNVFVVQDDPVDHYRIVEVTCEVDEDELDEDDTDEDGEDAIGGLYGVDVSGYDGIPENAIEKAALDLFHDQIGIATLDNYSITVRKLKEGESPEDVGHHLGEIDADEDYTGDEDE